MKIKISRALQEQMIAHAASDPRREVCGLLFGRDDFVMSVQLCVNIADDPAISFEIDPAALMVAHKAARAGGLAVVGCYHSHPNGRLALSERDIANAYEGQIWALIAAGQVGAWIMRGGAMHVS